MTTDFLSPSSFLASAAASPVGASLEAIGAMVKIRSMIAVWGDGSRLVRPDGRPWTIQEIATAMGAGMTSERLQALIAEVPEFLAVDLFGVVHSPDLLRRAIAADTRRRNGAAGGRPKNSKNQEVPQLQGFVENGITKVQNLNANQAAPGSVFPQSPAPCTPPPLKVPPFQNKSAASSVGAQERNPLPVDNPVDNSAPPSRDPEPVLADGKEHLAGPSPVVVQDPVPSGQVQEPVRVAASGKEHRDGQSAAVDHGDSAAVPVQEPGGASGPTGEEHCAEPMLGDLKWLIGQSKKQAAIRFHLLGEAEWSTLADQAHVEFPNGGRVSMSIRCIRDWISSMVYDDWIDNDGNPIDDWWHCEKIWRAWAKRWYEFEIKAKRDPYGSEKDVPCGHCGGDHDVRLFWSARAGRVLTFEEARSEYRKTGTYITRPYRCPACQPMKDGGKKSKWMRNCMGPKINPLNILGMKSGRPDIEVPR